MNPIIISLVLLWFSVALMAAMIFALARQVGILYERIAPAGALAQNRHLEVGADAPRLEVRSLRGELQSLGGRSARNRSTLLFFLSPDCPVCRKLLPTLKGVAKAEGGWVDVVLASDGDEHPHEKYLRDQKLTDFPYVVSEALGRAYGVSRLPYGVLIDEAGKIAAFGMVNSREHLDSLFEAKERKVGSIQEFLRRHSSAAAVKVE